MSLEGMPPTIRYFRDILLLPFDADTGITNMSALKDALPDIPNAVLKQVFSEHGRKYEFQKQYGGLELDTVEWRLLALPASERACGGRALPGFWKLDPFDRRARAAVSKAWMAEHRFEERHPGALGSD